MKRWGRFCSATCNNRWWNRYERELRKARDPAAVERRRRERSTPAVKAARNRYDGRKRVERRVTLGMPLVGSMRECRQCGQEFVIRPSMVKAETCSQRCNSGMKARRTKGRPPLWETIYCIGFSNCARCGELFTHRVDEGKGNRPRRFCTYQCQQRAKPRRAGRWRDFVVARDGSDCDLCGLAVDLSLRWPESDLAGVVDHIIPRRWGGTNARSNLHLAHALCNGIKGDDGWSYQDRTLARARIQELEMAA